LCGLGPAFRGTTVDRVAGCTLGVCALPTAVQWASFPHLAEPVTIKAIYVAGLRRVAGAGCGASSKRIFTH
jgi:hypothetical protein